MTSFEDIEREIEIIKERNDRVEFDKKWEGSFTRRFLLLIITYLVIGIYMHSVEISRPWLNAIVPAIGFMLSILILPFAKKIWQKILFHK